MQGRAMMTMRLFPRLAPESSDVFELVRVANQDIEVKDMWEGDATLRISPDAGEDVLALAPVSVQKGYRYSMGWSIDGGEVIETLDFDRF